MKYVIHEVTEQTLTTLQNTHPRMINTYFLADSEYSLYNILLNTNCILKINNGALTIDLGYRMVTIDYSDYVSLEII